MRRSRSSARFSPRRMRGRRLHGTGSSAAVRARSTRAPSFDRGYERLRRERGRPPHQGPADASKGRARPATTAPTTPLSMRRYVPDRRQAVRVSTCVGTSMAGTTRPAVDDGCACGLDSSGKVTAYEVIAWQPPAPGRFGAGSEAVGFPIGPVVSGPTPAANGEPYGTANMSAGQPHLRLRGQHRQSARQDEFDPDAVPLRDDARSRLRAAVVGVRADDGRACLRGQDGPDRVPRSSRFQPPLGRRSDCRRPSGQLEAESGRLELSDSNVVTGGGVSLTTSSPTAPWSPTSPSTRRPARSVVTHLDAGPENGFSLGLDLVANQMSGNLIMATGRTLHEQMKFNTNA